MLTTTERVIQSGLPVVSRLFFTFGGSRFPSGCLRASPRFPFFTGLGLPLMNILIENHESVDLKARRPIPDPSYEN